MVRVFILVCGKLEKLHQSTEVKVSFILSGLVNNYVA